MSDVMSCRVLDGLCAVISPSFVSISFSVVAVVAAQCSQMLAAMFDRLRLNALKYVCYIVLGLEVGKKQCEYV